MVNIAGTAITIYMYALILVFGAVAVYLIVGSIGRSTYGVEFGGFLLLLTILYAWWVTTSLKKSAAASKQMKEQLKKEGKTTKPWEQ